MWSEQTRKAIDLEEEAYCLIDNLRRRWIFSPRSKRRVIGKALDKAVARFQRRNEVANQLRVKETTIRFPEE